MASPHVSTKVLTDINVSQIIIYSSGGRLKVVKSSSVEELTIDNLQSIHFILVSSRIQKLHPQLAGSLMWTRTQPGG